MGTSPDLALWRILQRESPMTFAQYMGLCLYHPDFGYYAQAPSIGRRGDFFTSPCVHSVFGAALATQILEIWTLLDQPKDFILVEAGAGEGYLALDILSYLEKKGFDFPYFIIEPFPAYQARQKEILAEKACKVSWVQDIQDLPSFTGVFLSNELFDAFPVHLVELTEEGLKEVYVTARQKKITEALSALSSPEILKRLKPYIENWPLGYRTEVCLSIEPFFKEISRRLNKGALITIDYGYSQRDYYHPERYRGTLMCYAHHRFLEDPYAAPGHTDITAHVDFSLLKGLGERLGLVNIGFTQQAPFLVGLGVENLLSEVSPGKSKDLEALKMLILPQGLGMSHWVLIQARGLPAETKLRGFSLSNRLRIL